MDPTKKELYTTKRSSGVDCSDPHIAIEWERLKDDHDPLQWLLLGYLSSSPPSIGIIQVGDRFEELFQYFNNEECLFGVFRGQIDGQIKFFTFSFIGENVNGMKKGKASLHRSTILNNFEVHGSISLTGLSEANPSFIIQQISQLTRVKKENIVL